MWYNIYSMTENNKTKILIVEDEEILLRVFKEELNEEGFDVVTATNGEEAVTLAKTKKPGLILLDIILPRKNGFEVLEILKASPETKNIPVIMISVQGNDENITKALSLGASDYIVKSQHSMVEIINKIKGFLYGRN
ncbi:MAG: Response regulator receiver protein [Candidatus Nomurabacteria bacterium GW2011_GWA2_43_15]|uniref:Response regulator receiver protein n=3 Tax=Candidatus Nomuraibacteriota TaxID=1752729 RepID=A0A0G1DSJ0_9BACT|nr:MAG: Response regulator receiver protein [Candidatus Nomurabacteria bacterium GW2011_GWA2_43_15]KKT19962.1 MAG: Response regulator receiver protein [Candidatus Nomurabacteria bacterium GW2011_GWB1_43_7]